MPLLNKGDLGASLVDEPHIELLVLLQALLHLVGVVPLTCTALHNIRHLHCPVLACQLTDHTVDLVHHILRSTITKQHHLIPGWSRDPSTCPTQTTQGLFPSPLCIQHHLMHKQRGSITFNMRLNYPHD